METQVILVSSPKDKVKTKNSNFQLQHPGKLNYFTSSTNGDKGRNEQATGGIKHGTIATAVKHKWGCTKFLRDSGDDTMLNYTNNLIETVSHFSCTIINKFHLQ